MSWILITVVAYFFLALASLGDKFLIDHVVKNSRVYAFLISIMGSLAVLLAPWFLVWPGWYWFGANLIFGAFFTLALIFMFEALKRGEASRVTVIIGGLIPIFTISWSWMFFNESFSLEQSAGIALLLLGTFAIASISEESGGGRLSKQALGFAFLSALAYAINFLGTKYAYNSQGFWSPFIWLKLGGGLAALLILIKKNNRRDIWESIFGKEQKKSGQARAKNKSGWLVIFNQIMGALGSVLQSYAISFGSVAIINALQGVQYAFLLLLGWLLTIFRPDIIKENIHRNILIKKFIAVALVSLGLYFII